LLKLQVQPVLEAHAETFSFTHLFSLSLYFTDLTLLSIPHIQHSSHTFSLLGIHYRCHFTLSATLVLRFVCSDKEEVAGSLNPSHIYLRRHWCPSALQALGAIRPGWQERSGTKISAASTILKVRPESAEPFSVYYNSIKKLATTCFPYFAISWCH